MKLRLEIDGTEYLLDYDKGGYELGEESGVASIVPAGPDTYSVLLGERSHTVRLARDAEGLTAHVGGRRHRLRVTDARDRRSDKRGQSDGPMEVRSQMPGKVIKLLVAVGQDVEIGEGLIVVEAMKMQNEIKAQKSGKVTRVATVEGSTVGAGEVLLVIA